MVKLSKKQRIKNLESQNYDLVLMIEALEEQNQKLKEQPKTATDYPIGYREQMIYHTL